MCNNCKTSGKCDVCSINSIMSDIQSLKSPIIGKVVGDKIFLYKKNIIIGEIPFVYSESQFLNAFGKPLV